MRLTRILVAVLMVGVVALSIDATALACEVACATQQPGAAAPHEHGVSLGQHESGAMGHHETHGQQMMHETSAGPIVHEEMLAPTGQLQQCVTVNEVSLQAGSSRTGIVPSVVVDTTNQFAVFLAIVRPSQVTVAGSPPARNGPSQNFSILRI